MTKALRKVRTFKHKYSEDDAYLKTAHWKQFTKEYWTRHDCCEIFGAKKWKIRKDGSKQVFKRTFVVHHRDYKHLYCETDENVQGLCKRCHDLCHSILRMKGGSDFVDQLKEVVSKYFEYDMTRETS